QDSVYTWDSNWLTDPQYRQIKFRPMELTPRHEPNGYVRHPGGNCTPNAALGGTCGIDVQQKNPQYTYDIKVTVDSRVYGLRVYTGQIKMDHRDMIRQEYISHYEFTDGNPARRINCISSSLANAQGYCSGNNARHFPTRVDFSTPTPT